MVHVNRSRGSKLRMVGQRLLYMRWSELDLYSSSPEYKYLYKLDSVIAMMNRLKSFSSHSRHSYSVGVHCKKLEIDLKWSSQLQSGFIQVQVVVHLLLQGFSVTPLVQ